MNKVLSEFVLSDILVKYLIGEDGKVGLEVLPAALKDKAGARKTIAWIQSFRLISEAMIFQEALLTVIP